MAEAITCPSAPTRTTNHRTDVLHHNDQNGDVQLMRMDGITFVDYTDESQLDHVMSLVGRDLSEPYSSTYHLYFVFWI